MAAWETHAGLLAQAIPNYGKTRFVNISNTKQMYTFFPAIMGRAVYAENNKLRWGMPGMIDGAGGTTFTYNVQVSAGTTFAWVDETTPINVSRQDYQVQASLPWRRCRTHWSINNRELMACRGYEQIVDLRVSRKLGDDQDWADSFEDWGWGTPPASTDVLTSFPLRYWLFSAVESTATSYATAGAAFQGNGDFLNYNHASYTSGPAGISRVTYQYSGNYNFQHASFNDALVDKAGHAILKTAFHAPVEHPDKIQGPPDRGIYMGSAYFLTHAKLARQQNDMNTSDVLARVGASQFLRIPSYYVPKLDERTDGRADLRHQLVDLVSVDEGQIPHAGPVVPAGPERSGGYHPFSCA
jgi:hypothetical protein